MRPFQDLAPLKEKYFCPLLVFFLGNLRSVTVFLRFLEVSWDVFVKRIHMYCVASSLRDSAMNQIHLGLSNEKDIQNLIIMSGDK